MPGKVRNLATLGGPNKGVAEIPNCSEGLICEVINFIAKNLVYFDKVQDFLGPAGYFRDPTDLDKYLADSVFLPLTNNEKDDKSSDIKDRFSSLNGALLVMFSEDTVVYPKESEWFWELQSDYKTVKNVNETDFYLNDYIGLKELDEAGKVTYASFAGNHLQFTDEEIDNIVVPFLMS